MNKTHHVAGWKFGCIRGVEAKELHDNSGCSDSTDHSPPNADTQNSHSQLHQHIGCEGFAFCRSGTVIDTESQWCCRVTKHVKPQESHLFHRKIFVCGLNKDAHEASLNSFFSKFGAVEAVEIVRHKKDKRFKGFCYITFKNSESVQRVLSAGPTYLCNNRLIQCVEYKPRTFELEAE